MSAPAESRRRGPVLVAGAINTDLVARVAKAPDAGETVTGSTFAIFGGGKGANQAIAAARSGAPTAMFGALGDDDFGRQRRADLDAEGIDTDSVARSTTAASGVALIVVEEETGQNRISYVPGATMTLTPDQARAAVERVSPVVVLTTLEPPPETLDALLDAEQATRRDRRPQRDTGGHRREAAPRSHRRPGRQRDRSGRPPRLLLFPPLTAKRPLGRSRRSDRQRSSSPSAPRARRLPMAAETASFPAPRVDVVDTTGAGDAFCGAFAADLARGADPFLAARTGVVAGSLATTVPGAYPGIPRREAIEGMLARS